MSNKPAKICPFMSNADKKVECTEECKLYRQGKGEYQCYFQEIQAVSWNTKQAIPNNAQYRDGGGGAPQRRQYY